MSHRLIIVLAALKFVEILSAFSILVLAFIAPNYIFVSVILFGTAVALRMGIVLAEGLAHSRFLSRRGAIDRSAQPLKFWAVAGMTALVFVAGSVLTQIWRLSQ